MARLFFSWVQLTVEVAKALYDTAKTPSDHS